MAPARRPAGDDALALIASKTWGTTAAERRLAFPGDRAEDAGCDFYWRGVSVKAPPSVVFRWLCQLRAAPYSYDWIDNLGRRSPRTLTPGLEQLEVGQVFMTMFRLQEFETDSEITVATTRAGRGARLFGEIRVTYWARPESEGGTRLLVKLRVRHPVGVLGWLLHALLPVGDLVMMRRQLLNLRDLAEATPA